jgi:hypothetical protein
MLARRWLAGAAVFVALVALVGCSGGNKGSGNLATVSGVVTQNGAPLDGAKLTLHSTVEAGGQRPGSYSATTDSSGKYVIAMFGKEPGIPPGLYKVTITRLDLRGANVADLDQGQIEAAGLGKNALPKEYESLATTKLSVTLEPGKNENKNFELK